jgi:hypothetical protein
VAVIRGPQAFYDIAWLVLNQINADLRDNAVDRVAVYPGDIAWDHCECGMLAASVGRIYGSDSFPVEAQVSACAASSLVGALTFSVVRCAPQPPENAIAPDVTELDAAAKLVISDKWYLVNAVACTLAELVDGVYPARMGDTIMDSLTQPAVNVGPQGDCVGSQITALVQIHRGVNI